MKRMILRHPLSIFWKISVGVGLFLFVLGLVIAMFVPDDGDRLIVFYTVSAQGLIWLICGIVLAIVSHNKTQKLAFYKQEGQHFAAEIVNLVPVPYVNMGTMPVLYAECMYTNEKGQRCKVKTRMFMWKNYDKNSLKADVYVDYADPAKYAVEITPGGENNIEVDIDYT
ncbi:MAG: hypothetical protein FWF78_08150 [Defluviitaleaceae bacterium]|nr:hypothetical protein [Defluviitaleaceae bacterium]